MVVFLSSGASELVSDVEPVSEVAAEEDSERYSQSLSYQSIAASELADEVESTVDAPSELAHSG